MGSERRARRLARRAYVKQAAPRFFKVSSARNLHNSAAPAFLAIETSFPCIVKIFEQTERSLTHSPSISAAFARMTGSSPIADTSIIRVPTEPLIISSRCRFAKIFPLSTSKTRPMTTNKTVRRGALPARQRPLTLRYSSLFLVRSNLTVHYFASRPFTNALSCFTIISSLRYF
jgi:hypothetical protein